VLIEWLRLPGDIVFIAGGAIPTLYIAYLGVGFRPAQRGQRSTGLDTRLRSR
jgi:nitric oxide reductase subunit B